MQCPQCGQDASGRFCHNCGARLAGSACGSCGAPLSAGARFCHVCGTATGTGASTPVAVPWVVAGVAVVALLIVLGVTQLRRPPSPPPAQAPFAERGAGQPPDLSQMTPRQQADLLFNRIMDASERGVDDTAAFFTPMALQAYGMLGALDIDAHYHVGLIQLVAGNHDEVLARADSIAAKVPTHLYATVLRAEVADARGEADALEAARRTFLANYDAELAANRPEYAEHPGVLDRFRTEARQALGLERDR